MADIEVLQPKVADKMADNSSNHKDRILQALRELGEPVALSDIKAKLGDIPERTLHRWLAQWVAIGEVQTAGQKRGRRYFLPTQFSPLAPAASSHLLFSAAAMPFIERVRQPLMTRSPCTYDNAWFDAYQPNETFYLDADQRQRLMQQGRKVSDELPAGTYAQRIFNRLLIDLSYNSSRLEGNTYSLVDTQKLLLEGLEADNKLDEEKIMLLNHKDAIRFLVEGINRLEISTDNIRSLHYLLSDGLVVAGAAGQIRSDSVRIASSTYMPMDNRERLEMQLTRIADKARRIHDPFEQSFFLLVHIAYLQGFIDVNKRTARLACNIPLVRHNLVPLSFNDIDKDDYASAVLVTYEQHEVRPLAELYIWSYLRSCQLYSVTAEAIGIDPLRVQYRQTRRGVIREVVQQLLHGDALESYIQQQVEALVPAIHHEKFMADLRYDLEHLAPHNIAGMGFSRQELERWQQAF
ncbi:MAG: Fic family protein [Thiothrix sp.]|nr:Fic family protein [Thiothrix sp.]